MRPDLVLLVLHGMGATPADFAEPLRLRLEAALGAAWPRVHFAPVHYGALLQPYQRRTWRAMEGQSVRWDRLRRFFLYGFSDASSLLQSAERPGSPYEQSQILVADTLLDGWRRVGMRPVPVAAVAYSLGGHLLSNYIWDAQRIEGARLGLFRDRPPGDQPEDRFVRLSTLRRLITLGCNIPLFVAGHPQIRCFHRPHPDFRWLNFYDPDDILGWPLAPLDPSYAALVDDRPVNVGGPLTFWNPLSHLGYWTSAQILSPLVDAVRGLLEEPA